MRRHGGKYDQREKRIIIVNAGFRDIIMFNPVIVRKSGPYETRRRLPLPARRAENKAVPEHRNRILRLELEKQRQKFTGWPAQICQHEMDHLEGILI